MPEKERLLKNHCSSTKDKGKFIFITLQKREEAAINLAITEPSIKIVEYACLLNLISQKRKSFMQELSFRITVTVGLFILMFLLDTKVHTRDDIEKVTTEHTDFS